MLKAYSRWLFCLIILLSGCSVQLVADFDPQTLTQLQQINRQIDRLYLQMAALPATQRRYDKFQTQYLDVDVSIRGFVRLQEWRTMNEETYKQAQILAKLWQQDMQQHQKNGKLSDFLLKRHREQYQRLINTIAQGELAKKTANP
ncbi:hypothetical protein [Vibrio mangrovi]|uniref:Lipoprotein n=1 Tax=Vibrio mangrovi TaxID=474394 RepID=A0A1Y6IUC7_9VIBR|nr:hypothetical protein [Vibrio mangrovi]MDW6001881.1 hypothetical protein [Vibrio mangrovi]SMS00092.1 hypothetical protein VIM7927_01333 [Vibrio mangrovi]